MSLRGQRGVSLVEIMVALVLGLVLSAGVIQIYVANKQAYRAADATSRIQENARFAMDALTRDIRMAGFIGCGDLDFITPNVVANNPPAGGLSASNAVRGYEYDGSSWTPAFNGTAPTGVVADTDVISISRGGDCGANLVGNMTTDNANIQINSGYSCNLQAGDVLLISDCVSADIFRATNVSSGSTTTISHSQAQNTDNFLSKAYNKDARVYRFSSADYYIRQNAAGEPALFVRENGTEPAADGDLVEGVENMQILYGEDTDVAFDGSANKYVPADAVGDWSRVVSVRISLLLRSAEDNVVSAPQTYTYNDSEVTSSDRHLRRVYTTTIGLRNRLP